MTSKADPRRQKRIVLVQGLFSYSFNSKTSPKKLPPEFKQIISHLPKINTLIAKAASHWPLEKVGRIDLAILRLAVYEMTVVAREPIKVIINEAIEIAKEFGTASSPKFINGVLGTINSWQEKNG